MSDDLKRVGLVFKADGTVDFNKSLKEVNASIKENYSAFKLAKSQWDENTKASEKLKDQQKYLEAEIKDYTDKVKMLQGQLSELSEKESQNAEKIKKKTEQLDAARNTAESYRQKCDALKNELEQLEKDENSNAEAIQKKKSQVEKAEKAYVDYSSKAEKLETDIEKLNTGEANNEAAIQKKKAQLENTQATLNNYKKSLEEVNEKLKYGTADIEAYGKKLEETGEKISEAGKKISDAGGSLTKKISAPVTGLMVAATKTAADFDSAMSQVSAVSGATGNDLKQLRDKAREMGEKTKFSASEAAEAMNYMAMAGWKTGDMLGGIDGIMNLAAASGEDLATTSDIVTDALTAFGLSAEDSGHFADILAAASSNANTNVSMMGETFKYCAPVAGALGYSAEDTAEAIGLMANAGIKSSQAGTAMRTMLTSLQGDVELSGEAFGDVTVATTNADGSMRSLGDILSDLRGYFSQMTESEAAATAEALMGENAMSGFLAVMNAAPADIEKLNNAINNCDGMAEQMAETMQDNLAGQLTILKSQLEELAISFGETMMPVIRDIVSGIQGFVDKLNAMDEGQRRAIITIALVLAAIGPVLITIGKITTEISGVTKGIGLVMEHSKTLAAVANTVMGGIGKGASTLFGLIAANPVIAIIMAIIAVILLLYNKCEWFRDGVDSIIGSVVGFFQNFDDNVAKVKEGVTQKLEDIKSSAISVFDDIKNGIKEKIEWARDKVKGAVEAIKGFFDFQWSLPKIKLPHFSVTGKFGLNPPSTPRFNVEWYAKGGILNRPTIFGANGDDLMGGGEVEPEAVMPISLLKQYIRDEIQQNNSLLAKLLIEAIKSLEIKAVNNITIGDKRLYQLITEMVIKEISSKVGSQRASKGVSYA